MGVIICAVLEITYLFIIFAFWRDENERILIKKSRAFDL